MATPARWRLNRGSVALVLFLLVVLAVVIFRYGDFYQGEDVPPFPHGELRIAVDASYAPFAFYTPDGLKGLDIDLGIALGEYLNVPVYFVNMSLDGLYDSLIDDQADIIVSALAVDTWRLHEVRYTRSYFDAGLVLVSPLLDSMNDLPGHALAYEFGSLADSEAHRWLRRVEGFETQPYELPMHALDAVRLGVADAALVDAVEAQLYLRDHSEWQAGFQYITHLEYVIAVRSDREATFAAIDEALENLLQEGIVEQIIRDWL